MRDDALRQLVDTPAAREIGEIEAPSAENLLSRSVEEPRQRAIPGDVSAQWSRWRME